MEDLSYMKDNLKGIQERMDAVRGERDVTLIAAVKYTDAPHINYLTRVLGVHNLGENRVQQLLEHWETIDRTNVSFHFIGTLQRNKVKYIIDKVCMIHSLDSLSLAEEIQKQAAKHDLCMDVLVEINSGMEETKSGLSPAAVEDFCMELTKFDRIRLCGFMTMAPKCEKNEEYRKYFQKTYTQCLDIWQKKLHNIGKPLMSMGMSESFEAAILEGADMVRVGRALFQSEKNI